MRLTFIQLSAFVSRWRQYRLTDEDLQALEALLAADPAAGAVMAGTGGLRKARFAPPSWHVGNSGAMRGCYAHFPRAEAVYLFALYAKGDKANLTQAERNYYRAVMTALDKHLKAERPTEG